MNQLLSLFPTYPFISIAVLGLLQAVFMANAGGCWDNVEKIVEVDFKEYVIGVVFFVIALVFVWRFSIE